MTIRQELIREIYKNPEDDTRRLVYADAIQEEGIQNDRDAATVEFIQAACSGKPPKNRMQQGAYEWLSRNWKRLIPDTIALFATDHDLTGSIYTPMFPSFKRTGRVIKCQCPVKNPYPERTQNSRTHYAPSAHFTFWKGFLTEVDYWSPIWVDVLGEAVRKESPMLA